MEKKLISLVLAILMMVSILPMSAFAADSLPESEHPYADNEKQVWTYKGKEDTTALAIRFSEKTELEQDCDFIYIYDGDGKPLYKYTGTELSGETIYLSSNGFTLVLETDGSNTSYGFKIDDIKEIDLAAYSLGVIGDMYCDITADYETGTITLSPSAKNDGTHPLNFDIVKNVYWVNHVVINDGFAGEIPSLNCFKFADSFDICDGVYFNQYDIHETDFYSNSSNWENGGLYIGNYLVEMNKGTSVKNGTKYICKSALYGECVVIPDSVIYIGSDNCPGFVVCTEGSYAQSWAAENSIPYNSDSVKVKFKSPIINSGTPLSSAIEVYKLTENFEWESVGSNYSASGYKANQVGAQTVTIKTGGHSAAVTIGISSGDEQYINFNDPILFNSLIKNGVDSNGDGIISVDEMENYYGDIGLYGVSDVSGLEYAENAIWFNCVGCYAPLNDIFRLQKYSDISILLSASKSIMYLGRLFFGVNDNPIRYSSSNPKIVSVSDEGRLVAESWGEVTITAKCNDVSKAFVVRVITYDEPTWGISDSIPEIVSTRFYNDLNGDVFQLAYGKAHKIATNKKILMNNFYSCKYGIYSGIYYLTDDNTLWMSCHYGDYSKEIGTDIQKITSTSGHAGAGLALDTNGNCWSLYEYNYVTSNVKDICGMFLLTKSGDLYRCYDDVLIDNDLDIEERSVTIVKIDSGVDGFINCEYRDYCYYIKSGKTYYVRTSSECNNNCIVETNNMVLDTVCNNITLFDGAYYYIDAEGIVWKKTENNEYIKICDDVKTFNTIEYDSELLTNQGEVYFISKIQEDKENIPALTNVKKMGSYYYLDNDNNLYTSVYDRLITIEGLIYLESRKPVKIMSDVVDFKEGIEDSFVVFTRKDGSIWSYSKYLDYPNIVKSSNVKNDKMLSDVKTGIRLYFESQFDLNVKLETNEVSDINALNLVNMKFGEVKAKVYDISVKKNSVKVQPNGSVTVSIPVPENFDFYDSYVCSIDMSNGKVVKLDTTIYGGYATFTTDHLGRFAIVQEVNAELGDVNADGVINSVDALRVLQHSVSLIQLQGDEAKRADVNADKIINSNDALNILRYSVGLITSFSEIK